MSLAMLNGATVTEFVEDKREFANCVKECFEMLDVDGDGVLSYNEFCDGFYKLLALGKGSVDSVPKEQMERTHKGIFERFDVDKNGKIDYNEFTVMMKEIMSTMARGIGNQPILVALEMDSLLMKAVDHNARCGRP